jgi:hypothetical protein
MSSERIGTRGRGGGTWEGNNDRMRERYKGKEENRVGRQKGGENAKTDTNINLVCVCVCVWIGIYNVGNSLARL